MMEEAWQQTERIQAEFTLSLDTPEFRTALAGDCKFDNLGDFQGRLLGPFGIRMGDVVMNRESYQVRLANGRVMEGVVAEFDLEAETGLPLPTQELTEIFQVCAQPPEKSAKTVTFEIVGEDSLWLWRVDQGNVVRDIVFDPKRRVTVKERWYDEIGDPLLEKEYDEHMRVEGHYIAHSLSVRTLEGDPVDVNLVYTSLKLNPDWNGDPFEIEER